MKISELMLRLFLLWFKYGNCPIDMVIENDFGQTEAALGEVAVSPKEPRLKLLSEGFT